jgi:Uma2 family endonuclease
MAGALKRQRYTFDDFLVLVRDKEKADLLDGVIYMASPEAPETNRLFVWLIGLLDDYVELLKLGEIFGSRVAFRLEGSSGPEPDIAFVALARLARKRRGYFDGAPDVAFEIVSAESVERDYFYKKGQYERHGVREYWIIDESKRKVTLLRLNDKGKYREVKPKKGVLRSEVVTGFWLKPGWLWSPRRPKAEVLQEILGEK